MEKILIFYGPFIVVIVSIVIGFYVASKDGAVTRDEK
ncbi:cytochrome bd oxidase small subunit CydS [Rummeliibacillus pycnus]